MKDKTIDRATLLKAGGTTGAALLVQSLVSMGLAQARAFHESTGLTGIILTKLDSTAKGGIVFAIEQALGVPVRFVGVGEKVGDLVPFDPAAFVGALFG